MLPWQEELKQLHEEIKQLKIKLAHPHIAKSQEGDYDIKTAIIEKQNRIIEIYIKETATPGLGEK